LRLATSTAPEVDTVAVTNSCGIAFPGIFDEGSAVGYESIVPEGDVPAEGVVTSRVVLVSSRDEIEDHCNYDNNQTEEDQDWNEFERARTCHGAGK